MKLAALATLALISTAASAVNFNTEISQELSRLQAVGRTSSVASDRGADPSCKRKYADLYNKRVVKVTYGFGYGDSTPGNLVWDDLTYNAFYRHLRLKCRPGVELCGFTPDRKDARLLRKIVMAPTGESNYIVELRITKASLSRDNASNTTGLNGTLQSVSCANATAKFMGEVAAGADIVIYNGHSRDGGGPDFCPARLTADRQHVDYPHYQRTRPGIGALTTAMKQAVSAGQPNNVVGMFSCSSQLHFQRRLLAASPTSGLILTHRIANFREMILDSFAALDGLLAQRCNDGFEQSFGDRRATLWTNMFSSSRNRNKSASSIVASAFENLKEEGEYTASMLELGLSKQAESEGNLKEGYIDIPAGLQEEI